MSIDYRGSFDFGPLDEQIRAILPDAMKEAVEIIKANAVERAPLEDGKLRESAVVDEPLFDIDGVTGSFTFTAPWARKEHEHLYYHHKGTGGPKFAELALISKGPEAVEHIGDRIREVIES